MSAHLFLNSPLFSFLSPKHRIQHIRQWFHGIQYFLQRIGLCSRLDEQRLWRQMEIIPQTFEINISGKSRIVLIAGKFQLQSQSQIVFDIRIVEVFDRPFFLVLLRPLKNIKRAIVFPFSSVTSLVPSATPSLCRSMTD